MQTVSLKRHIAVMDKITALSNVRERSRKETRERLARSGFSEEEIQDGIDTALRVGLISDERYARSFIRGKVHAGWGREKIIRRLEECGVDSSVISACQNEFASPEEEYERALHELEKRSCHAADPYASYMRRLLSKGYSHEVSRRAVHDHLSRSHGNA